MIVFCNTTPLIALSSIDHLNLLKHLFGEILLVQEVVDECAMGGPIKVPNLSKLDWIKIVASTNCENNHILLELDKGEKFTLHMAKEMSAQSVIIDEKIGRNVAEYMGLSVIGTLGILLNAKRKKLLPSFSESVLSMRSQGIYYHENLVRRLIKEAGEDIPPELL